MLAKENGIYFIDNFYCFHRKYNHFGERNELINPIALIVYVYQKKFKDKLRIQ